MACGASAGVDPRPELGELRRGCPAPSPQRLGRVAVERRSAAPPIAARIPASATARAAAAGCQYMSQKRTVPVRIISTQASRVPQ